MVFGVPRPTQQLNLHCSNCGDVTVRFESWVADGQIFEMVGTKLSEMLAFLSASPDIVLCSNCADNEAVEKENRRLKERERIMQQMELPPSTAVAGAKPAMYGQLSLQGRSQGSGDRGQKDRNFSQPLPRRAHTSREQFYSTT
jgi:hypothetical protein